MQSFKKLLTLTTLVFATYTSVSLADESHLADILLTADSQKKMIPVLSANHQIADTDMAYRIQKKYVEKKSANEKVAGFKAGLTSKGGQKKFGVSEPVAGVLFESGRLNDNTVIDKQSFHRLMLETEIGFVVGTQLSEKVPDITTLKQSIQSVMPVIELPELGFTDMKSLQGVDIIAANVASKQYIIGQPKAVAGLDLNAVTVSLALDGEEINQGKGSDASGNQWEAALWLVNLMIDQGWTIEPGQVLITGALGKMLPGKAGQYVADFGQFGQITFKVK